MFVVREYFWIKTTFLHTYLARLYIYPLVSCCVHNLKATQLYYIHNVTEQSIWSWLSIVRQMNQSGVPLRLNIVQPLEGIKPLALNYWICLGYSVLFTQEKKRKKCCYFLVAFSIPYCYTEHIIISSFTDFYNHNFISFTKFDCIWNKEYLHLHYFSYIFLFWMSLLVQSLFDYF